MLAQILAGPQEQNAEIRRTANAGLERIDRQARGQMEPVRREPAHSGTQTDFLAVDRRIERLIELM